MNKKNVAIVLEILPIVSAILTYVLIYAPFKAGSNIKIISGIAMIIALFGFLFFIIGRILAKEDRTVKILGILDCIATLSIIVLFVIIFIAIGSAG